MTRQTAARIKLPDIIVFHTAWMARDDGDRASLSAGGFRFALENGYGHEMLNFRNIEERMAARPTSVSNLETSE